MSVVRTLCATLGPWLVTVSVKLTVELTAGIMLSATFVIRRSAEVVVPD